MGGGAEKRPCAGSGGRVLFTLKLEGADVRARKKGAPGGRPHADKRRKEPRRRPDHFAEIFE